MEYKYRFTIENKEQGCGYFLPINISEIQEDGIEFPDGYWDDFDSLNFDQIDGMNGNHVSYGCLEIFEQSSNVPEWYDRNSCTYSFREM